MIPKIIHYCWFGRGEKSDKVVRCINTWHKIMPEYEIIEWNEDNFNVGKCLFSSQAYELKKYAFVSDYARLAVLEEYGGIYFDVDMEAIKTLDECLDKKCFLGYEGENGGIATCVIGAEPHDSTIQMIKAHYESMPFVLENGENNEKPNTVVIEELLRNRNGINFDWKEKQIGNIYFYDWHVFHPLSLVTGKLSINETTLAIHRHTLLWVSNKTKIIRFIRMKIFIPLFGEKFYVKIKKRLRR